MKTFIAKIYFGENSVNTVGKRISRTSKHNNTRNQNATPQNWRGGGGNWAPLLIAMVTFLPFSLDAKFAELPMVKEFRQLAGVKMSPCLRCLPPQTSFSTFLCKQNAAKLPTATVFSAFTRTVCGDQYANGFTSGLWWLSVLKCQSRFVDWFILWQLLSKAFVRIDAKSFLLNKVKCFSVKCEQMIEISMTERHRKKHVNKYA